MSIFKSAISAALYVMGVGIALIYQDASAAVITFYTNRAVFESTLTSMTTIDFGGFPNDGGYYLLGPTEVIEGVTFSGSGGNPLLIASTTNPTGGLFSSVVLFADGAAPITADLSTAGTGFTAVGGAFGDMVPGGSTTMTLIGTSGVLDVRSLPAADLLLGHTSNFFGWVVQGDSIISIEHDSDVYSEVIDNFVFGVAGDYLPPDGPPDGSDVGGVPEPATFALLTLGLVGLGFCRRKKA